MDPVISGLIIGVIGGAFTAITAIITTIVKGLTKDKKCHCSCLGCICDDEPSK